MMLRLRREQPTDVGTISGPCAPNSAYRLRFVLVRDRDLRDRNWQAEGRKQADRRDDDDRTI